MTAPVPARAAPAPATQADAGTPPSPGAGGATLVAVVHLDMVGYSHLVGLDEVGTLARLRAVRSALLDPMVARAGGRVVNSAGDSILAVFGGVTAAVRFALGFQQALAVHQAGERPDRALRFRIGVTAADVLTDGTDVHGDGVNIAARLQAACPPGAVCVSRAVRDQVRDRLADVAFAFMGKLMLHNIARPVEAYVARPRGPDVGRWRRWGEAGQRARRLLRTRGATALAVALLCLAAALWHETAPPAAGPAQVTPRDASRQFVGQGNFYFYGLGEQPRGWLAARELYQRAMAADPSDPLPAAMAALTYTNVVQSRLSADAAADMRTAEVLAKRAMELDLGPDQPQPLSLVAQAAVLRLHRRFAEALAVYRRIAAYGGQYPSRANVGLMLVLLGRPVEALEPIRQVLAEAGETHAFAGTWLTYLGMAQLHAGVDDFGVASFRRALSRRSFLPPDEVLLHLAAALALSGDAEGARAALREVQARRPTLDLTALRQQALSDEPAYLAQREALFRGLRLAGAAD